MSEFRYRMITLARNLAIGGALCEAYRSGPGATRAPGRWAPNVDGKAWRS